MANLFYHTPDGFKPFPDPKPGYGFAVIPLPNEVCEKMQKLSKLGHFERELRAYIEDAVRQFFVTRNVEILTPAHLPEGLKIYDPRDPLKERINRT